MSTHDVSAEISFIPAGSLRCVITDRLRPGTPEEHVRQRVARSLIDEYGYSQNDIAVEFPIHIGSMRKRVDLAIFPPESEHAQQNICIVVECKRERIKPTDEDNGVGQLHSYVAASIRCRFGMWVGSEVQVWEKTLDGDLLEATSIPRFGSDAPRPPRFADLVPAETDLQSVFRRCHDYIYGNQGLQKELAFNELLNSFFARFKTKVTYPTR